MESIIIFVILNKLIIIHMVSQINKLKILTYQSSYNKN
jgi:hypothetical protein